jgi:hypothetical protein
MQPPGRVTRIPKTLGLIGAALLLSPVLVEAILVAPHAVFMDHRSRTGQVFLVNTGDSPEEVDIGLTFGYPDADSNGTVFIRLIDQPDSTEPSAASWIKAYPRRVVLNPGQRQVVRLLAQPPAALPDGEYWTRLIATSRGSRVAVVGADSGITAGLSLQLRTIISVSYRKGAVRTGVTVTDLRAAEEGDSLVIWVGARRQGNAAYLGTLHYELVDANQRPRWEWDTPLAVYHQLTRKYVFPIDSVPPGHYTLTSRLTTERSDLDRNNVLPAPPVFRSVDVEVH